MRKLLIEGLSLVHVRELCLVPLWQATEKCAEVEIDAKQVGKPTGIRQSPEHPLVPLWLKGIYGTVWPNSQ